MFFLFLGNEYPALVEYAPFQKIPKPCHQKKDIRCGTIDEDPDYLAFLDILQNPEAVNLPQIETLLEEIENIEKETRGRLLVLYHFNVRRITSIIRALFKNNPLMVVIRVNLRFINF